MNKYEIPLGQLDYKPKEIRMRASTPTEVYRLKSVEKEPKTVEWIETFVEDDIFFDVGANVGAYSLIAAHKLSGKGRVYAFEPAAPTFASLVTNVIANHLMAKVIPLSVAFVEKDEISIAGLRSLEPGQSTHTDGATEFPQPFVVMSMDTFIERYGIPCPTKVKIDVDGAEVAVVKGMLKTLADPRLKEVLIETRDNRIQEQYALGNIFRGANFTLKAKHALMSSLSENVWNRLYVRTA